MSEPKFKIGDRVIVTSNSSSDDVDIGQIGTIREYSVSPWVEFDKPTRYAHKPASVRGRAQHMDCLGERYLDFAPAEPARIATPAEMASIHRNVLPTDAAARNAIPLADGLLYYFPNALAAVSALSKVANEQHNPGEPMHWARNKSHDHANKIMKHLVDAGGIDADGQRHSAKVAWRALALLEDELIAAGATPGRNAIGAPDVLSNSQQKYRAQHAANVAADAAFHNCIEDEV